MNLEDLGYNNHLETINKDGISGDFEVGRVIAEYKERYTVRTVSGEYPAEITGNLRYTATGREDFPAVGDWVELMVLDPDFAIIHKVLPRHSVIKRQAVSQTGEVQVIAANIDVAFIVQAVDRDFNINRLERYLTLCHSSKVHPVILLTKTDLIPENRLTGLIEEIQQRIENVPVLAVSNETEEGYDLLLKTIEKGKTYCLLGSSGVATAPGKENTPPVTGKCFFWIMAASSSIIPVCGKWALRIPAVDWKPLLTKSSGMLKNASLRTAPISMKRAVPSWKPWKRVTLTKKPMKTI
jgi:hypothetical protein